MENERPRTFTRTLNSKKCNRRTVPFHYLTNLHNESAEIPANLTKNNFKHVKRLTQKSPECYIVIKTLSCGFS